MPTDFLDDLLRDLDVTDGRLGPAELERVSRLLTDRPTADLIDATARVCALSWEDTVPRPDVFLQGGADAWWIDLDTTANRAGVVACALAALLAGAGIVPPDLVRVVGWLPLVLDPESATVTRDGSAVAVRVRRRDGPPDPGAAGPDAADLDAFVRAVADAAGSGQRVAGRLALVIEDAVTPSA